MGKGPGSHQINLRPWACPSMPASVNLLLLDELVLASLRTLSHSLLGLDGSGPFPKPSREENEIRVSASPANGVWNLPLGIQDWQSLGPQSPGRTLYSVSAI